MVSSKGTSRSPGPLGSGRMEDKSVKKRSGAFFFPRLGLRNVSLEQSNEANGLPTVGRWPHIFLQLLPSGHHSHAAAAAAATCTLLEPKMSFPLSQNGQSNLWQRAHEYKRKKFLTKLCHFAPPPLLGRRGGGAKMAELRGGTGFLSNRISFAAFCSFTGELVKLQKLQSFSQASSKTRYCLGKKKNRPFSKPRWLGGCAMLRVSGVLDFCGNAMVSLQIGHPESGLQLAGTFAQPQIRHT